MGAVTLKLIILPATGLVFYHGFHMGFDDYLPAMILLSTPTATVTYVMAKEMAADAEFSVAAISASTLFSSVTSIFWLSAISI